MGSLMWCMAVLISLAQATATSDSTHRIVAEESIFGLVAYKAGFAAALVDNNLTYARTYTCHFVQGPTQEQLQFELKLDARNMDVNESDVQQRWFPRLKELGILDTPFKETSEWRRGRMSKTVASERLLDAEHFPQVEARAVSVTKEATDPAGQRYRLGIEITIRGKTQRTEWPATIVHEGDEIVVETYGPLQFTDFGIDPFSRFFGAIRYEDNFYIFAHMVAVPITAPMP